MSEPLPQSSFNPEKAYLAPIGLFAQDLLGEDIADAIAEAARVQALLVVMGRHMVLPPDLAPDEAARYKSDQLFKQVFKQPAVLESEIADMVPADHDLAAEIKEARALVDSGKGVPDAPPFGVILSKKLSRDTVNQALQVQAGLRVLAITDEWPGRYNIVPPRLFDNDPAELNMIQSVLVSLHGNYLLPQKELRIPADQIVEALPLARDVAIMAINNAQDMLNVAHYNEAVANLQIYQVQKQDHGDYATVTQRYFDAVNKGPSQNPTLAKPAI